MAWTTDRVLTDRLLLRAFVDDDKDAIVALRTNADVYRYLGGPAGPDFADEIRDAVVGEQWGVFAVVDVESSGVIGSVAFHDDRGEMEVSYELLPERWGLGLGSEMVTAALGWAADNIDASDMIAVTQTANASSTAMLDGLGFERESTFEEFGAEQAQYRRSLR